MALTPPPAAPQRGDRATFAQRVDAFITWLINFVSELVGLVANLNSIAAGGAYAIPYAISATNSPGALVYTSGPNAAATSSIDLNLVSSDGVNYQSAFAALATSTSASKAQLRVQKVGDPSKFTLHSISAISIGASAVSLGLSPLASSGPSPFTTGDAVILLFQRTGDKGDTGVMGVLPRAKFREQRASGTSAGIAVNGANTRDLNTTEFNGISGASLASSSVTLPAGTYDFRGWAMRYSSGSGGGGHKAYLHNVTDNTTVSFGSSGSIGTLAINDLSLVSGRFTIAAAKTFQLRHYIEATSGSGQSLGFASSSGFAEVYSEIEFLKVA